MSEKRCDKPSRDRKGAVFAPETGPLPNGRGSERGYAYLAIGLVLMTAKIVLGIVSGSKALVVSAMLSMQDCVWAGVVLVRSKTTGRPASR